DSAPPSNINDIINAFQNSSNSVTELVQKQWTDDSLLKEANMYGENWKNGTTLSILIKHQAHHRGQLTVLMRQAGLKVPGVYGPAKEEWAQWNMVAPD
ncbi:MAG: hypothetical protein H0X46_08385, partial [Bacteroidetes bacterium]|nr:hypothetical protein [Bacteroidota bacterium]